MSRVIHFDVPVDDSDRAIAFYEKAIGWRIDRSGGPLEYWLATTGQAGEPGIDGALRRREAPGDGVVLTVGVDDLGEAMERVVAAGGKIVSGRLAVAGVGWLSTCTDTEGNKLALMQQDPAAS